MSPGAALAGVIDRAPVELLFVIASVAALLGLIRLYWFIRRSVIPWAVPGALFRNAVARVAAGYLLRKTMK